MLCCEVRQLWIKFLAMQLTWISNGFCGKQKIVIREGHMVLLKDDSKIPLQWPLGRVVKIYPGPVDIVRVVDVKTAVGIYKRPVNRICLLPFEASK